MLKDKFLNFTNGKWMGICSLLMAMFFVFIGCRDDSYFDRDPDKGVTIEDQLRSNPEYSKFMEALESTGLINYIGGSGLWTVFVPVNEAFEGVNLNPSSTEERIALIKQLNYHIGIGLKYTSAIDGNDRIITRNDKYLTLTENPFTVDGINFGASEPDQDANNGVIHEINSLLEPIPNGPEKLQSLPDVSMFSMAMEEFRSVVYNPLLSIDRNRDGIIDDSVFVATYGLAVDLGSETSSRTIFAPTNEAINDYLADNGLSTLLDLPRNELLKFINQHILIDYKPSAELSNGQTIETSGGTGTFVYDPAILVQPDVPASNAIVHIVNKVLAH